MGKKVIFFFIFLFILVPLINAEEFGYNYLEGELNVAQAVNYSLVNVNNSQYFQSYTPTTLGNWLETTFSWITNAVNDLTNYYTKTEIETNYVPYNSNIDLGSYNLTIDDTLQLSNTTTTWNMYVDVNGTLVWEQE